jgi:hypothetical protein
MSLPNFTAEKSIYKSGKETRSITELFSIAPQSVVPQARNTGDRGAICGAGCLGGYIGGTIACALDDYPSICASIEGNVYNRCLNRC